MPSQDVSIAVIKNDLDHLCTDVREIKEMLEKKYVTKEEFDPIKKIVYGVVGLVLTAIMVGILALVIK